MSKILDRTDEINYNTYGTKMKIIKYNTARDIIVDEMSADEILELAQRQGSPVNIDVEEY